MRVTEQSARSGLQRAGVATPGAIASPRPLAAPLRNPMERAFQHDFSGVRVHADRDAANQAAALDAAAFTRGNDIFLGAQTNHETVPLLAHELAHVAQQANPRKSSPAAVEAEADRAATAATRGERVRLRHGARSDVPHCRRVRVRSRNFEVGDVNVNAAAQHDILNERALMPGPDQAFLIVSNRQLGYDVARTTPDDPFRWEKLRDIVDNGHVNIVGADLTTTFRVKEVTGQTERIVDRNLITFRAGGITLPRLSVVRAIEPNQPFYVASADDRHDTIVYEQRTGTSISNSLAHELYGHLWLSMHGVSWKHGRTITPQQSTTGNVRDPFGRPFSGETDVYIREFAGASTSGVESPTQGVSDAFLNDSLAGVEREAVATGGLTRQGTQWQASAPFIRQWARLSNNYGILRVTDRTRAAGVVTRIVTLARGLDPDRRFAFDQFISDIQMTFIHQRGRGELARDVQSALRAPVPAPTTTPTPAPTRTPPTAPAPQPSGGPRP